MALHVTRPRRDELQIGRGLPSAHKGLEATKSRAREIFEKEYKS